MKSGVQQKAARRSSEKRPGHLRPLKLSEVGTGERELARGNTCRRPVWKRKERFGNRKAVSMKTGQSQSVETLHEFRQEKCNLKEGKERR